MTDSDMCSANKKDSTLEALRRNHAIMEIGLDGEIISVSQRYCEALGYAEEDIVGRHHSELCDPEYVDSNDYNALWRRLSSGGSEVGEFKRIARDGSQIWVQATCEPIFDPNGLPSRIIELATGLSERGSRDAELEALDVSTRRFAALSEAADNWFWETDADGRFTYLSENFERIIGESPERYLGKRRSEIVERFDDDVEAEEIEKRIAKRLPFKDLEYRRSTADGRRMWVRVNGAPKFGADGSFLGYHGASSDITEQMLLRERRDLLARLVDGAPIGLILLDAEFRIALINKYLSEIFRNRYKKIEVGSHYVDLILEAFRAGDIPVSEAEINEYIADRIQALRGGSTEIERSRGDRVVEIRSIPFDDGSTLLFEIDVTIRKELRDQLVHAQRLDAIGQITAGVAHDFNNLLAIILGNLELISDDLRNHESYEFVETALSATKRGAALTEQLLAFGRHANLEPRVADVDKVIRGVKDLLRRTLPENIDLDLRFSDGEKFISVDVRQLEQAIINLVINARDAIEGSGLIVVSTSSSCPSAKNKRSDTLPYASKGEIVISVTDDGHGIAAEQIDKVFEPFYTTKEVGRGSGLGLSMVHGFVSQLGGGIAIQSAPGSGTTISMSFPECARPKDECVEAVLRSSTYKVHDRPMLLVEDDAEVRRVMRAHLEALGYIVAEASDGQSAVRELSANPAIELILTDFVMPGELQGGELIAKAKRMRPSLKAIMMTGYAEKTALDAEAGEFEILLKPVSRANLQIALARVDSDLGNNEVPAGSPAER